MPFKGRHDHKLHKAQKCDAVAFEFLRIVADRQDDKEVCRQHHRFQQLTIHADLHRLIKAGNGNGKCEPHHHRCRAFHEQGAEGGIACQEQDHGRCKRQKNQQEG